jgi:hypothetical protein
VEILLKIMGGALGLLVPCLFVFAVGTGIARAPLEEARRRRLRTALVSLTAAWTAAVWASSLAGVIDYQAGDRIPRVFVCLVVPVLVGLVAVLRSADLRVALDHAPPATLVGVQAFRFAGAAFLLVVYLGILPPAFAGGGYGDLATATLAVVAAVLLGESRGMGAKLAFWGFSVAGLADLVNVAYLLAAYYPIWHAGTPSSAPLGQFALVMVPAIAAPFALLLHVFAIRSVVLEKNASSSRLAPSPSGLEAGR